MKKKIPLRILTIILSIILLLSITACNNKPKNLSKGLPKLLGFNREVDKDWTTSSANFALSLYNKCLSRDKNTLISPLSVMVALSMAANGADNKTLTEMEKVIGGNFNIEEINEYLSTYLNNLPSSKDAKFNFANSLWFNNSEDFVINKDFLTANANYYNASQYMTNFDNQTVKDINNWVKQHTDGDINKIIDDIEEDDLCYIINALTFDAEWENKYEKSDTFNMQFKRYDGSFTSVPTMSSTETKYIEDDKSIGFIKDYKGKQYSFVAILPNEDVDIFEYLSSLTGEKFINLLKNVKNESVKALLPKFSYEYQVLMNDQLIDMGMTTAFNPNKADFSKLGTSKENIFISKVLHKAFINVDEDKTKASAVTIIGMKDASAPMEKFVRLDRPFIYAIVDNNTNLPIFLGTIIDL